MDTNPRINVIQFRKVAHGADDIDTMPCIRLPSRRTKQKLTDDDPTPTVPFVNVCARNKPA